MGDTYKLAEEAAQKSTEAMTALTRALDKLADTAGKRGYTDEDFAKKVAQLVGRGGVTQKYAAYERLGLDRGASTAEAATALRYGSQRVYAARAEEARQRAEKERERRQTEADRQREKADRDRARFEKDRERQAAARERAAFEAQPWRQEQRREVDAQRERTRDFYAPGRADFRAAQYGTTKHAVALGSFGFGETAGTAGRISGAATGLDSVGFTGAATALQRAALPLAVANSLASGAEGVAGMAYDNYSTGEQKGRQFVRDFVPGGARVQRFVDAMTGRAAGYEQAGIDAQMRSAESQYRGRLASFEQGFNPQQAGREGYARAAAGQSAITPTVFDRSSAVGERAYREEQRLLPLKKEQAKAEREYAAATAERLSAQQELNKANDRARALENQRAKLERDLQRGDNQSGVSRQNVLLRIRNVNEELTGAYSGQQSAIQQSAAARGRESEAGGAARLARARTQLLGQADVLDERAQTALGSASRIGGMNPFDRMQGLQAARLIADRGSTEGLPQEVVQAGLGFAPQTVGKIVQQTGAQSEAYKLGAADPRLAADFPAGDPNALQKQADELRKQFAEVEDDVNKQVASALSSSFKNVGKEIGQAMRQELLKMKDDIIRAIQVGRNP